MISLIQERFDPRRKKKVLQTFCLSVRMPGPIASYMSGSLAGVLPWPTAYVSSGSGETVRIHRLSTFSNVHVLQRVFLMTCLISKNAILCHK